MPYNDFIGNAAGHIGDAGFVDNWTQGRLPEAADDVRVGPGMLAPMLINVDAWSAVALASFSILSPSFAIGADDAPVEVTASEIRVEAPATVETYLAVQNAVAPVMNVQNAGKLLVLDGKIKWTSESPRAGNVLIRTGSGLEASSRIGGASVMLESGVTVGANLTIESGVLETESNIGAFLMTGGTLITTGTATLGAGVVSGGANVYHNSTGAIGAQRVNNGSGFDGRGSAGYTASGTISLERLARFFSGQFAVLSGTPPVLLLDEGARPTFPAGTSLTPVLPS